MFFRKKILESTSFSIGVVCTSFDYVTIALPAARYSTAAMTNALGWASTAGKLNPVILIISN